MRLRHERWILVGQTPVVEPSLEKWAEWFETAERTVFRDEVGASVVSTVFLGLDHNFSESGPPLLFETMVFTDGDGGTDERRCSTWIEAEAQHKRVVAELTERYAKAAPRGRRSMKER